MRCNNSERLIFFLKISFKLFKSKAKKKNTKNTGYANCVVVAVCTENDMQEALKETIRRLFSAIWHRPSQRYVYSKGQAGTGNYITEANWGKGPVKLFRYTFLYVVFCLPFHFLFPPWATKSWVCSHETETYHSSTCTKANPWLLLTKVK